MKKIFAICIAGASIAGLLSAADATRVRHVAASGGFLTEVSAEPAERIARGYLTNAAAKLGLDAAALDSLYTEREYRRLTAWMLRQFRQRAIAIARVYHCPFHPRYGKGRYRRESTLRKPAPGMILKARREFDLDLAASVLIGDKPSDIAAGKAAGVGANILFSPRQRQSCLAGADQTARSLLDIAAWLRKSGTPP